MAAERARGHRTPLDGRYCGREIPSASGVALYQRGESLESSNRGTLRCGALRQIACNDASFGAFLLHEPSPAVKLRFSFFLEGADTFRVVVAVVYDPPQSLNALEVLW